jgi:hypothetical protein
MEAPDEIRVYVDGRTALFLLKLSIELGEPFADLCERAFETGMAIELKN